MTSDPSLTRQDSNYATQIQAALDELQQMQEVPRVVTNPEALDALEREIRGRTARLSSLLLGLHLQHSLDSEDLQAEQALLVSHWPKPLKNDGRVQVWVRTAGGYRVPVWVTYYRAHSHLSGQGSNRATCEVAICFNRFQRPAL